ncbi:MAG: peptidoglycan recognition protein family protein [Bacillota bacterium]
MVKLNYQVKHIKKNKYSRPGYKLLNQQAVMDHWTANYGASADDHYRYFNETVIRIKRYAGAHIFVDRYKALELIPLDEGTFGGNDGGTSRLKLQTLRATDSRYPTIDGEGNANLLCIHVEMCVEEDGTIHPDTIARAALVHQYLQKKFPQLKNTKNRFVRHFDVTGKNCPAPMVSNPNLWKELLELTDAKVVIPPKKPVVVEVKEENTDSNKTNWVRSNVDSLRYYSKPSWKNKDVAGHLPKGYGFPQAVRKVRVEHAWQYEVKNSKGETYYLTASNQYVTVEHKPATSTAKKPSNPSPKPLGPKGIGEIKIVNVRSAAIIQDQPDRKKSMNLGTIAKGKVIQVTGSVRGENSESGYWEVIFKDKLAYVTAEFGEFKAY